MFVDILLFPMIQYYTTPPNNSILFSIIHTYVYSTRHRNVPVLESYNGRKTEETLQSVGRFFTTSRRLHYRSKDVPFLRTVAPFSIKR